MLASAGCDLASFLACLEAHLPAEEREGEEEEEGSSEELIFLSKPSVMMFLATDRPTDLLVLDAELEVGLEGANACNISLFN